MTINSIKVIDFTFINKYNLIKKRNRINFTNTRLTQIKKALLIEFINANILALVRRCI